MVKSLNLTLIFILAIVCSTVLTVLLIPLIWLKLIHALVMLFIRD